MTTPKNQPDEAAMEKAEEEYVDLSIPEGHRRTVAAKNAFIAGARWAYEQGFRAGIEAALEAIESQHIELSGFSIWQLHADIVRAVRALLDDKGDA